MESYKTLRNHRKQIVQPEAQEQWTHLLMVIVLCKLEQVEIITIRMFMLLSKERILYNLLFLPFFTRHFLKNIAIQWDDFQFN